MTTLRPIVPEFFGVAQGVLRVDLARRLLVRCEPGQDERNAFAALDRKLGDGGQIFAARLYRCAETERVRSGERFESAGGLAHPRDDLPAIETDNQLHANAHLAGQTLEDADQVGVLAARRHEIDQSHGAALCLDFRFEDQRVTAVSPTAFVDLTLGVKEPAAIVLIPEQRCKAGRRIEARKAQPIDTAVAANERAGLRIAQKRIIFDAHMRRLRSRAISSRRYRGDTLILETEIEAKSGAVR